jgi:hypothetical protein
VSNHVIVYTNTSYIQLHTRGKRSRESRNKSGSQSLLDLILDSRARVRFVPFLPTPPERDACIMHSGTEQNCHVDREKHSAQPRSFGCRRYRRCRLSKCLRRQDSESPSRRASHVSHAWIYRRPCDDRLERYCHLGTFFLL